MKDITQFARLMAGILLGAIVIGVARSVFRAALLPPAAASHSQSSTPQLLGILATGVLIGLLAWAVKAALMKKWPF
jgi:protein-S-isoprenylcysteine O-methyltransferase Ste14